jgi:protein-tyrosine phosphatase
MTAAGLAYLHHGTADDLVDDKPPEWFRPAVEFILDATALPRFKTLIYCAAGLSRAPSLAYAVMRAQGWPADLAEAKVCLARQLAGLTYKDSADRAVHQLGYT